MSKIDELVERLCHDGVEFIPLKELCENVSNVNWDRESDHEYRYIDLSSVDPLTHKIKMTSTIDASSAPSRARQIVMKDDVLFATTRPTQMRVTLVPDNLNGQICSTGYCVLRVKARAVIPSYLLYLLGTARFRRYLDNNQTVGNYPSISDKLIKQYSVPVPPVEIQEEIVRILDSFSELEAEVEAELEAELEKRQSQYIYYRNQLLSRNNLEKLSKERVEHSHIEDVCTSICSGGTPSTKHAEYYDGGTIPWVRTQDVDYCRIEDSSAHITEIGLLHSAAKWIPANCVIVAMYGATAAKVAMNSIPVTTNQACCNLAIDSTKVLPRYVYHWLACHYGDLKSLGEGSQANISGKKVRNYPIDIPSLNTQKQIVNILDKFDALVSDLSSGIPAEIEARRKQYEYYRDKLLTFKEKPSY